MSVAYNNQYVDEKYSGILEPNLYFDSVFAEGKTFTGKYEVSPAGGIQVHKLSGNDSASLGVPGRDFDDEATSDVLIPIIMNNNFQKSKKIYGVQANAVEIPLAEANLSEAVQAVAQGAELSALACLVAEAKVTASLTTTALTTANLKKSIIGDRKAIVKGKGKADVLLMSPDAFALMLEANGKEYTPESNDFVNASGQVGKWLGFDVYECNALAQTTASYYDSTGTLVTKTLSDVDYIMYNKEAFSMIPNFNTARIVDSENFVGSKAQVELNVGYKVTNGAQACVKKH